MGNSLLEILVKYEKKDCGSLLVPKMAKEGIFFGLKYVGHESIKAGWRMLLVYLKIFGFLFRYDKTLLEISVRYEKNRYSYDAL